MSTFRFSIWLLLTTTVSGFGDVLHAEENDTKVTATAEQLAFVHAKVIPLLEARCFECHKHGKEAKGALLLSNRRSMLKGGDSGAAIVPGKPEESLLIEAVRYESFEMPPRTRMPAEEVAILEKWIADGAHWPVDLDADPVTLEVEFPLQQRKESHWAWQPIGHPAAPDVNQKDWVKDGLDRFILAGMETKHLAPAADADRYALIRRLYIDLIGLPPSIAQIEAFVGDNAEDDKAIATVVDELLASPHFGERWGRHWLDLVRYAETLGHEFDYPLHNAWRYRDYVIRAFNADVPYDDFVREHVAGDLLEQPRLHPEFQSNESIIGTGFWFLSEAKHAPVDVRGEEAAMVDNQIDVFSKTFLGMTVACARCHDHKFDAIATKDYYALAGFLQSSRRDTAWLDQNNAIADRLPGLLQSRREASELIAKGTQLSDMSEQFAKYPTAAMMVARGEVPTVEDAVSGRGCSNELVRRWVDQLKIPANKGAGKSLSLLSTIALANPDEKPQRLLAKWMKNVKTASQSAKAADDTTLITDFKNGIPENWLTTGQAFTATRDSAATGLYWTGDGIQMNANHGVSSATLSRELRGTLSSPTFELKYPEILVRVAGEGCRMRLVIDGYVMNEFSALLFKGAKQAIDTKGELKWIRIAGDVHRYQGQRAHLEFLDEGNGWMTVKEIRFANKKGAAPPSQAPSAFNLKLAEVLRSADNTKMASLVDTWTTAMIRQDPADGAQLFNSRLLPGFQGTGPWDTMNARWTEQATGIPAPVPVIAIAEGSPENEHVFIRGNHRNLGEEAPRNIPTALRKPGAGDITAGSGRLQLADELVAAENPLLARVAVNRIWHHLFGVGIVESTDNFGVLGKLPTHPELLDHLSVRFRNEGWSVKTMIRHLVLSRTYRLSSDRNAASEEVDPTNQLLHRARIRRLQGEAVRDAILTVSGRLDRQQLGPSVPVHLTPFMQGRGRPKQTGPLDGNGRRSIYMSVNRNFLSPFMQAFDVPAPVTTTGRRTSSNVPAQALIMLNNEFVNQQADVWATRLLQDAGRPAAEVIHTAWYELFGRPPSKGEVSLLLQYSKLGGEDDAGEISKAGLTEICHVLLNSKEFMFLK